MAEGLPARTGIIINNLSKGTEIETTAQYEPWKVVSVAFATGVFLALGGFALGLLILAHFIQ